MAPERIGGYRIVELIAPGGMGEVYLAVSQTADRVALKLIKPELVEDESIRARFAAEVDSLKQVYGSLVARLEDADPYADPPWLAVEYVPGATLRQHVDAHGPMPLPTAAMIAALLADGLAKVHQQGLLHRDLKPQNIILGPAGPRLIDFGLAVLIGREHGQTRPGEMVGTPAYMAPEQIDSDGELTSAVDVYGLAATVVYALTGHHLYPQAHGWHLVRRIADPADPPDLTGLPVELTQLIGAMLAFDPTARPSLAAVKDRMLQVATATSGSSVADLRRMVVETTFDASRDLPIPPELTDPVVDPERGIFGDPEPEPPSTDPGPSGAEQPAPVDPAPTPTPPMPRPEVSWLVEQVRQRYARRPTLLS
ncbi:serine/threonine-protein kinase [Solwaraspora sp. WMMB335]|uniref:serine/threonine-protein kinase n=1 Tax=Solwaraspora sp. WMMB335 TaxID=3404118 RepID=UPI003B94DA12